MIDPLGLEGYWGCVGGTAGAGGWTGGKAGLLVGGTSGALYGLLTCSSSKSNRDCYRSF